MRLARFDFAEGAGASIQPVDGDLFFARLGTQVTCVGGALQRFGAVLHAGAITRNGDELFDCQVVTRQGDDLAGGGGGDWMIVGRGGGG